MVNPETMKEGGNAAENDGNPNQFEGKTVDDILREVLNKES